ncbi:MAG: hypothetical protein ACO35E_02340 [Ilumatobacteraceae bacterium]
MTADAHPTRPVAPDAVRLPGDEGRHEHRDCMSCGSHLSRPWSTSDGTAWLCRECATLHGIGCP